MEETAGRYFTVVRGGERGVSPFQSLLSLRGFFSRNLCFTRRPSCLLEKVSTISISRAASPISLPRPFPLFNRSRFLLLRLNNRTSASRLWLYVLKNFPIVRNSNTIYLREHEAAVNPDERTRGAINFAWTIFGCFDFMKK